MNCVLAANAPCAGGNRVAALGKTRPLGSADGPCRFAVRTPQMGRSWIESGSRLIQSMPGNPHVGVPLAGRSRARQPFRPRRLGVARPMDAQAELGPCCKREKVGSESPHLMPMQLGEPVVPAGRWVSAT